MSVYALIMAGGEGKRFWPLSSRDNPKQFLRLTNERSLLQNTYDRISAFVENKNIYVITTKDYARKTTEHLPQLDKKNILSEPVGKNTGPCVYYGCKVISDLDEDAVVVVLPADHAISNKRKFINTLKYGIKISHRIINRGQTPLVTLGIKPTRPDTGYGYIKKGKIFQSAGKNSAFSVLGFTEKPDIKRAIRYYRDSSYLWNSGIFIWKTSAILSEYERHYSHWKDYLKRNNNRQVSVFYKNSESGPVDKMILEKSSNSVVVPADFGWSDIGTWQSLDEYLRSNPKENITSGDVRTADTSSCLIMSSDRPVLTIGVKDLVIVNSRNGIMVINKNESQKIKELLDKC